MKNKSLYETSNWVLDFVLLIIFGGLGIVLVLSLDLSTALELIIVFGIVLMVYALSQNSLYKVIVYKNGIHIHYYIRPKKYQEKDIHNSEVSEVRYYSYTLNSPVHLRVFFMSKSNRKSSFRFNIEEKKAVKLLKMYESLGIKITDSPKGALYKTDFYGPDRKDEEKYR